jgi:cytochrome P450
VVRIAPNEVAIADVSSVSQIHKVGSGFLKSAFYTDLVPNAKPGIFAMRDPHDHAMRRRLFARAFSHNSLRDNWEAEIRSKVELAVQKIKHDAMGTQKGADVLEWWTLMATDIIAHLNFGDSFNMLETGKVR